MVLRTTLVVCIVASLTACANNTALYNPSAQRMSTEDLDHFKYDCNHAAEQRKFLQKQLSYISPLDQGPDRAIIEHILYGIREHCEIQTVKFNGCIHVREDMTSGSANATVCNDPRALPAREAPTINHWDPLVDK